MLRNYRTPLVILIASIFSTVALGEQTYKTSDEKLPSGRLEFLSTSFGLIVGYNAGEGKLYFEDREYPFSVKSIKVGTVGVSKVQAIGSVYNLTDIADFEGRYGALDAGMTLIQGGNIAILENKKGVRISLQTYQHGAEVSLGASGIDIVLQAVDEATASASEPSPLTVNKYYQKTELPPIQLQGQ